MTSCADEAPALAPLLSNANALLLDFDGPVCAIFASTPASVVAEELSVRLRQVTGDRAADLNHDSDPLNVLRLAARYGPDVLKRIAEELTTAEERAVRGATPTPGADSTLHACKRIGLPVAIVSNNSMTAASAYLAAHALGPYVTAVVGRTSADPDLMKPNPYLVQVAIGQLGVPAHRAVLVGDSVTDIEAGRKAGVLTIGYANKPGKRGRLTAAGAYAVVRTMEELAIGLPVCSDSRSP
jgi:phosphoglycolate phosphatase